MCVKTSIINRNLPLIAHIEVGTTENAYDLNEKLFARYVLKEDGKPVFAFIETSIPKSALVTPDTNGLVKFNLTPGKKAEGVLDDRGAMYSLSDKSFITKVELTGAVKMEVIARRFSGWVNEQIPDRLPIAIIKGTERARSPYYALLLI